MPRMHARPAPPRFPQRAGRADRGSLGADDRRDAVGPSCTVTVDADDVETCSGPEAGDALSYAAFGDHGTREFFTHVRFHKHDEDRIVVHLLVELYARSAEEATEVLEEAARGTLAITSLAEESRPPASTGDAQHSPAGQVGGGPRLAGRGPGHRLIASSRRLTSHRLPGVHADDPRPWPACTSSGTP